MPGLLYIKTFGCQMNEYDSGKMRDVLEAAHGMTRTDNPAEADVLLVNTCSVREKAQEKVFSLAGRMAAAQAAAPACGHRRRRLRREPGGRGHHRARALRRSGVRPADPAPPAGDARRAEGIRPVANRHQLSGDREIRPAAAAARGGRDRVRLHHGGLQQVLQLLRRALHARRGDQPPLRAGARGGGSAWPLRACAKSRCSARTSMPMPGRWRTARSRIWRR